MHNENGSPNTSAGEGHAPVAGRVARAVDAVRRRTADTPGVAVVLGSGLADVGVGDTAVTIPYAEIDGFAVPTVAGHTGTLLVGKRLAVFSGRFHWYEGHDLATVVLPIYLMHALGVRTVILTNAAGGINADYRPGDIVLIKDHINLLGVNPLRGPNDDRLGPRFPDMSAVYSRDLRHRCLAFDPLLPQGVYAAMAGPSYETPAEIRMLRGLGADLVGMSTVPEAIVARYLNMAVLGLSCVTNVAAGLSDAPLNHAEVVEVGRRSRDRLTALVRAIVADSRL